jgi:thiol-disulfide isomerase/thioredoxin
LLIKDVVENYKGRVRFVSENWGTSKLAERYGVKRYPVVFVDEVLVAKPEDFGGWGRNEGRYAPWRDAANHEKFKRDLSRMIEITLRGKAAPEEARAAAPAESLEIAALPAFSAVDLAGRRVESSALAGQVVVVEFWATWCPPCRSTLGWLGEVERLYGERVTVVAVAVESPEAEVRELTEGLKLRAHVLMGTDERVAPFGTVTGVPTMFVFDQRGKTAAVFYGAPPDLHEKAGRVLEGLLK